MEHYPFKSALMQAEWGKGKKRAEKEGKQDRIRDRSNFKAVLITFFARRGRKLF